MMLSLHALGIGLALLDDRGRLLPRALHVGMVLPDHLLGLDPRLLGGRRALRISTARRSMAAMMGGKSFLRRMTRTMMKEMSAQMIWGTMGCGGSLAVTVAVLCGERAPAGEQPGQRSTQRRERTVHGEISCRDLEDREHAHDHREEAYALDEGRGEDHGAPDVPGGLRLPRDALDGASRDAADPDAHANAREAGAEAGADRDVGVGVRLGAWARKVKTELTSSTGKCIA